MAVKIRLKRLGKVRVPQYRIVVVDSRKKRDGRVIEEIGKYHPKEDPSYIDVVSDRAQYWLGVGAQPTEAVEKILKITGDWQKFKGLPGTEGTLKVKEPKRDKLEIFNEALKDAASEPKAGATTARKKAEKKAEEAPVAAEARPRLPLLRLPPRRPPPRPRGPGRGRSGSRARRRDSRGCGRRGRDRRDRRRWASRQGRVLSGMLADALEHLVRGVVDNPDDVTVRDKQLRRGSILEVRVHPDDLGKVIGRNGRTATAFRTVIGALAGRGGARIDFVDVDRGR